MGLRSFLNRQQNVEAGTARLTVEFDCSLVVADEGLGERETESAAVFPTGNEREKNSIADFGRNAGSVVDDLDGNRESVQFLRQRNLSCHARAQGDLALAVNGYINKLI